MQISVTFRHVESSEALKDYAIRKLSKMAKYTDSPMEANVVLGIEKFRHQADITVTGDGFKIKGKEETGDMYSAIDLALEKIEKQFKRFRERPRTIKSGRNLKTLGARLNIISPAGDEETETPQIIRSRTVEAKPMDIDEAVMQLQTGSEEILVFTNSQSTALNILYRRRDGNFGLIEPEPA
ncbi:MAG: ribosome-associated translation inhibitor RaiA [Deltaproteobacteria bacterium]|nr:ribosome-associated translation inhibitor RaiA [Deltaproteobacteria bacterium]